MSHNHNPTERKELIMLLLQSEAWGALVEAFEGELQGLDKELRAQGTNSNRTEFIRGALYMANKIFSTPEILFNDIE